MLVPKPAIELMKTLLKRIKLKLSLVAATCLGSIVSLGLLAPISYLDAGWFENSAKSAVSSMLSWLIYLIFILFMGKMATWATELLMLAASIDTFTTHPVIIEAWGVVRDLSNMFFIVILMFIAFGTLFRIENYSWKKLLPKMVMAAILVNFSRAIVGVIVDISQIIMLTFVEAIKPAAVQGFVTAFQLDKLVRVDATPGAALDEQAATEAGVLISLILAGVMLSVMVIVQCVYIVVIIGRAAFIWFLTVLSPLAFTMMVLPATEKYFKTWFEMLGRYASVGPMVMFYLWLAMYIAAKTGGQLADSSIPLEGFESPGVAVQGSTSAIVQDGTYIVSFTIATMMLLAGLKMAQDNASELGSVVSKASSVGKWVALGGAGLLALKALKVPASAANDAMQRGAFGKSLMGLDFNFARQWGRIQDQRKTRQGLNYNKGYQVASERAKQGGLWAVLPGAMDQNVDQYMPLTGQQGFSAVFTRAWGRGDKKHKAAAAEADEAKTERDEIDKNITDTERTMRADPNNLTQENQTQQIADARQNVSQAKGIKPTDKIKFDEGSAKRDILKLLRDMYHEKLDSSTTSDDEKAKISASLLEVDKALDAKGEVKLSDDVAPDYEKRRNRYITDEQKRADDLAGKTPTLNEKTLAQKIAAATADMRSKRKEVDTKYQSATRERLKWAPESNMIAVREQKKAAAAIYDGLESTNEEFLRDQLMKYLNNGDVTGTLGMMRHMAKVGHSNEVPVAFGEDTTTEGMRNVVEKIKAIGGSEEHIYSELESFSQDAQNIGHWWAAQLIGYKNGKRHFRDDATIAVSQRNEMLKTGATKIAMGGNRLAIGGYVDGQFVLDPNKAGVMASSMHLMGDMVNKGNYNPSQAKDMAANEPLMRRLINLTHKDNEAQRVEAHRVFQQIISTVSTKESGGVAQLGDSVRSLVDGLPAGLNSIADAIRAAESYKTV